MPIWFCSIGLELTYACLRVPSVGSSPALVKNKFSPFMYNDIEKKCSSKMTAAEISGKVS